MSPAAVASGGLPSRSAIEGWETTHLSAGASRWRQSAAESEDLFARHRQNINAPGGTVWEGDAKDAALDRVTADLVVVRSQSDVLREAAESAEIGATDIEAAQRDALSAITAAEVDGFRVREDLSVADARPTDISTLAARQTAAVEHAEDIRWAAERLMQTDALVGERLAAKAADLEGIRFDGEVDPRDDGTVQLVDNETETPEPEADAGPEESDTEAGQQDAAEAGSDEAPNPKDPHATDPNRSADGTYGPGNSGDGKAAEKAALDERERRTHVPIVREQVRATHPDVNNPETGKPQQRYYDGLEPTGNPDEYIGIEAKTNEDASRPNQERFDDAVSADRPATAVLDGREIKIVDAQTVYPPEGWVPPSAQNSDQPSTSGGGGAESGASGPALPPSLTDPGLPQTEGSAPLSPADTPRFPDWGTDLTPQEMIDSGDPALIVLGQEIRRRMAEQGTVDPSGLA